MFVCLLVDYEERSMINAPLQPTSHVVQDHYHKMIPRTIVSAVSALRITINIRKMCCEMNKTFYDHYFGLLEKEKTDLQAFQPKRKDYELSLKNFNQLMLQRRRQRSLQRDIELRKKRLDSMRAERLKTMQEAKRQQLQQAKAIAVKKAAEEAQKQTVTQIVAKRTKQAIRDLKDAYQDLQYRNDTAMDAEEQKMAMVIRERNKDGIGSKPEGIRSFQLTVGLDKTETFKKQNDRLKERGMVCMLIGR